MRSGFVLRELRGNFYVGLGASFTPPQNVEEFVVAEPMDAFTVVFNQHINNAEMRAKDRMAQA